MGEREGKRLICNEKEKRLVEIVSMGGKKKGSHGLEEKKKEGICSFLWSLRRDFA